MKTHPSKFLCIFLLTFLFCLGFVQAALSSVQQKAINWANKAPISAQIDVTALGSYLGKVSNDEYTRALTVYCWVAANIRYDWDSYKNWGQGLEMASQDADDVLRRKMGVCAGYANLMVALCKEAHLKCVEVSGFAKGYSFEPGEDMGKTNHAWNAIQIYGQWQLVDATWGASEGKPDIDFYYFCASPRQLLDTHFPEDEQWQLLAHPLDRSSFLNRPRICNAFHALGFERCLPLSQSLVNNGKLQTVLLQKDGAAEMGFSVTFTDAKGLLHNLLPIRKVIDGGVSLTWLLPNLEGGQINIYAGAGDGWRHQILSYCVVAAPAAPKAV